MALPTNLTADSPMTSHHTYHNKEAELLNRLEKVLPYLEAKTQVMGQPFKLTRNKQLPGKGEIIFHNSINPTSSTTMGPGDKFEDCSAIYISKTPFGMDGENICKVDDGAAVTKEGTSVLLSTSKGILAINSTSKLGLGNVQNMASLNYILLLTSGTWGDHGMVNIPDTEFIGVSLELGWIAG